MCEHVSVNIHLSYSIGEESVESVERERERERERNERTKRDEEVLARDTSLTMNVKVYV